MIVGLAPSPAWLGRPLRHHARAHRRSTADRRCRGAVTRSSSLAALLTVGTGICVAGQPGPPVNVSVKAAVRNNWVTGAIVVSWDPPLSPGAGVASYAISVQPLNHTFEFLYGAYGLSSDAGLEWDDFVRDTALAANTIGADDSGGGRVIMGVTGQSGPSSSGRGRAAYMYHRIPEGAEVRTVVDCAAMFAAHDAAPASGALPAAACGLLVFDAGSNAGLLTCALTNRGGAVAVEIATATGQPLSASSTQATNDSPWPSSNIQLRLIRDVAARTWNCSASVGATWDSGAMTVISAVLDAQLRPWLPGDLWYGLVTSASNGTSGTLPPAVFSSFTVAMPVPASAPPTILGAADVCLASPTVVALATVVDASATNATFTGLSSSFPYAVSVVAVEAGTGAASPPSLSVRNGYTFARPMPPRAFALGAWYDSKWLTGSSLARWVDSSGNGHHLEQPATSQRPGIRAGDLSAPAFATFRRRDGTFMTGGADSIDLGVTGPFTMYVTYRGTTSTPQLVAGRGPLADDPSASFGFGWAAMVYNDLLAPYPGYIGLRIGDAGGTQAGGRVDHFIDVTGTLSYGTVVLAAQPVSGGAATTSSSTAGSDGYWGGPGAPLYNSTACRDANVPCSAYGAGVGLATAANSTFSAAVATTWGDVIASAGGYTPALGGNDSAVSYPVRSVDVSLRVGGPAALGGDPYRAFDGDIAEIIVYNEEHDASTRAAVMQWVQNWLFASLCPMSIATPNTNNGNVDSSCANGGLYANCYQQCNSGYGTFVGTYYDHYCSNGLWSGAPLICRRACPDIQAPRYVAACSRHWLALTWDTGADPMTMLYFITWPQVRIVAQQLMWQWDRSSGNLLGNTTYNDPCERITTAASAFAMHPSRWSSYIPYGVMVRVGASVMLLSANTSAGIVFRLADSNNHYRVFLGVTQGARIVRTVNGVANTIAALPSRSLNFTVTTHTWYRVEAVAQTPWVAMVVNNITVLNVSDTSNLWWGSSGLALDAASVARFDDFAVDSGCDLGQVARYMTAGVQVSWTCKPGYVPVGNTTLLCGTDGTYAGASLNCRSNPPVVQPANFTVQEHTANNTFIGTIQAQPANLDQSLEFTLVGQTPFNGSYAFSVAACSGAIRIADPAQIDYRLNPIFTLWVRVAPDGEVVSSVTVNVTIVILNVLDIPVLLPTSFFVNESYIGPVEGAMEVDNPDNLPLTYAIATGNVGTPPLFILDTYGGNFSVGPPGATYSSLRPSYALAVTATYTPDDPTQLPITVGAIATINVLDVNTPPTIANELFMVPETLTVNNTFVGILPASDPDTNPAWNVVTLNISENSYLNPTSDPSVDGIPLFRINPSSGALFFNRNLTFLDSQMPVPCNNRVCRAVVGISVAACDNAVPPLCTVATATIAVVATNQSQAASLITSILPVGALRTQGGDTVIFGGQDFPLGALVVATYGNAAAGWLFSASCYVSDEQTLICLTGEGWGALLTWSISFNGIPIPSTVPLVASYALPTIASVTINPIGMSTRGSGFGAVGIRGSNFGPPQAPVTIVFGANHQFSMTAAGISHTLIQATMGEGCGANLPVTIVVGGQTALDAAPGGAQVSYPPPTLVAISNAFSASGVSALNTYGGDVLTLNGSDFGPLRTAGTFLVPIVTYTGGPSRQYTYTAACTKDDAAYAHTRLRCTTAPGVGADFTWSIEVCGQISGPSQFVTSYAPPVLTSIGGPGALRASTEGGQIVRLTGDQFGPIISASDPPTVLAVPYGKPGQLQFAAEQCSVTALSPPTITCITGPGTGRGLWWQVNVGGQWSAVLPANTSYAPPVISFFTGSAANTADTRGYGQNVTVVGFNFGADIGLITVSYIDFMTVPRDRDGVVPGSPPGMAVYTPPWCSFQVPHRELTCGLDPGAGAGLTWQLVVDEQQSTAPTTSFAPPSINSIQTVTGLPTVSTDGGDAVLLLGVDFGLPDLIQSVRYGPTGADFSVSNFTYVDHTMLNVTLGAGIGANLKFTVTVADQPSDASVSTLSYAQPRILSVAPASGDTQVDPSRPNVVTVAGYEFGLLAPNVEVGIAFGNPDDNSLLPLIPILSRTPALNDVLSPGWVKPASPVLQTVSFPAPEGLGAGRAVRVIPYNRGAPPSLQSLATVPMQLLPDGSVAAFTYNPPAIGWIVVSPVTAAADIAAVLALFPGLTDASQARKLEIAGRAFGPAQAVNGDAVVRVLETNDPMLPGVWNTSTIAFTSWDHRSILGYTTMPSANVRVRISSVNATGALVNQASNVFGFSSVSPTVEQIVGQSSGFATQGGDTVTFLAYGMDGIRILNATVGGSRCILLSSLTGQPILETQALDDIIIPQCPEQPFPPSCKWTIRCIVPPGQGAAVPVMLIRDGLYSDDSVTIAYAPPAITSVGVWTGTGDNYNMQPFPAAATPPFVVGTTGARMRVVGTNLGTCPSMAFVVTTGPVRVDACLSALGPDGLPVLVPNPAVARSHTYVEFPVPDGEGALTDTGAGFSVVLDVGAQFTSPAIPIAYAAPVVTSVTPDLISTRGGVTILVSGANMGCCSVPTVSIGSARRPWLPCSAVVRLSHFNLTCVVPPGSGSNLLVNVTVAGQAGAGASLNYSQPVIATLALVQLNASLVFDASSSSVPVVAANAAAAALALAAFRANTVNQSIVPAALAPTPPFLVGPASGLTYAVVLNGSSFGPWEPGATCLFAAAVGLGPSGASAICNGQEDFLGEGELPTSYVLYWDHELIVALMPPGAGWRTVYLLAGTQLPDSGVLYPNFMYQTPTLVGPLRAAATTLSTDGGDLAMLTGFNLPVPTLNSANATSFNFPVPLPLAAGALTMFPTENLRINFASKCLSSAYTPSGAPAPGLSGCLMGIVQQPVPGLRSAWAAGGPDAVPGAVLPDTLSFVTPPGLGANKNVSVSILVGGALVSMTNTVPFSYDAPAVTAVSPRPIYDDGTGGDIILISGTNIGRLQDIAYYSPDELQLSVKVGSLICEGVERVMRAGITQIQCKLPVALPAGSLNLTVTVANQDGIVPARDPDRSVFIGCTTGYFAHSGEVCLKCPAGADCAGFVADNSIGTNASIINVTAGPVTNGNIQYDWGGIHTYPLPRAGFYDLNGTMTTACPGASRIPGRDVCIVACIPMDACVGGNLCASAYASEAPFYRCGVCAKGHFRSGTDCIPCPQNPALVFAGVLALFAVVLAAGYLLHRYKFNIAVISLGVDFFQVISLFAQAKVRWPPLVKRVYEVLSSFNLNIDLMAPECLLPKVSFTTKFVGIVSVPIGIYGVIALIHAGLVAWKWYGLKRRDRARLFSHLPALISASLIVLFLAYLNITRTLFSIFICLPTNPPDGKTYLNTGTVEACGEPGGAQVTLMPYAIFILVVYTLMYPLVLGGTFWRQRELVMEDQLLRARGMGDDRLTNPHAYLLRVAMSRTYYQFKPDLFFWTLAILGRKFCVAFAALIFATNTGFQLAATLLVLFLAYAAQVRWRPFMPPSEYEAVIRWHLALSQDDPLHNRLRASLAAVEAHGRKLTRANSISRRTRPTNAWAVLAHSNASSSLLRFFMNYNTVESFLLFSSCIICLCGLMFITLQPGDSFFEPSRDGVTALVLAIIALSSMYYACVVVIDLSLQCRTRNQASSSRNGGRSTGKGGAGGSRRGSGLGSPSALPTKVFTVGEKADTTERTQTNPLFYDRAGKAQVTAAHVFDAVTHSAEVPDPRLWDVFRQHYAEIYQSLQDATDALNAVKLQKRKGAASGSGGNAGDDESDEHDASPTGDVAAAAGSVRGPKRKTFAQVALADAAAAARAGEQESDASDTEEEVLPLPAIRPAPRDVLPARTLRSMRSMAALRAMLSDTAATTPREVELASVPPVDAPRGATAEPTSGKVSLMASGSLSAARPISGVFVSVANPLAQAVHAVAAPALPGVTQSASREGPVQSRRERITRTHTHGRQRASVANASAGSLHAVAAADAGSSSSTPRLPRTTLTRLDSGPEAAGGAADVPPWQ